MPLIVLPMRASWCTTSLSHSCPTPHLPLLDAWAWLALFSSNRMHHDLVRILRSVGCISFTPVVADRIGKDLPTSIKGCSRDSAASSWISLKSMLGNSIPKVKSAVRTGSAKGAVLRVEGDGVDRIDVCHVVLRGVTMTFERKVGTRGVWSVSSLQYRPGVTHAASFSSTY